VATSVWDVGDPPFFIADEGEWMRARSPSSSRSSPSQRERIIRSLGDELVQDLIFFAANARSPTRLSKIRIFFMAAA